MKNKILIKTQEISKRSIDLSRKLKRNTENQIIKKQFLRAVLSIGANYREAVEAESRKDFTHKLCICKKESREALYWLGLIIYHNKELSSETKRLRKEVNEIFKILSKSIKTLQLTNN